MRIIDPQIDPHDRSTWPAPDPEPVFCGVCGVFIPDGEGVGCEECRAALCDDCREPAADETFVCRGGHPGTRRAPVGLGATVAQLRGAINREYRGRSTCKLGDLEAAAERLRGVDDSLRTDLKLTGRPLDKDDLFRISIAQWEP